MRFHEVTDVIQWLLQDRAVHPIFSPGLLVFSPCQPRCPSELTTPAQRCSVFFWLLYFSAGPGTQGQRAPEAGQDKGPAHKGKTDHCHLVCSPSFWFLSPSLSAHKHLFITANRSKNLWQGWDQDQLLTETVPSSDQGWKTAISILHSQIKHQLRLHERKSTT